MRGALIAVLLERISAMASDLQPITRRLVLIRHTGPVRMVMRVVRNIRRLIMAHIPFPR